MTDDNITMPVYADVPLFPETGEDPRFSEVAAAVIRENQEVYDALIADVVSGYAILKINADGTFERIAPADIIKRAALSDLEDKESV